MRLCVIAGCTDHLPNEVRNAGLRLSSHLSGTTTSNQLHYGSRQGSCVTIVAYGCSTAFKLTRFRAIGAAGRPAQ
jgi:hypothetical protein